MSKQLVLMVDDELDNRVMMRYFLESWGYDVDLDENGQEALDKVDEKRPALILLDLEMPVLNGFETCERLKENPDTEDIPVIMFTGLEATSDKVRGINGGVFGKNNRGEGSGSPHGGYAPLGRMEPHCREDPEFRYRPPSDRLRRDRHYQVQPVGLEDSESHRWQ